jgi:hypothetical protein
MTDDEILKRADEIRAARAETFRAEAAAVEARVQSLSTKGVTPEQPAFTDAELCFAAFARCTCGAGLAYLYKSGMHGRWDCSAILKGDAARGTTHDGPFPFAFYSIKSEGQPSAQGATTRPQTEGAAA